MLTENDLPPAEYQRMAPTIGYAQECLRHIQFPSKSIEAR